MSALFSFGMHRLSSNINTDNIDAPTQIENIEESFKKIRLGTRKLLEQTEQCLDEVLDMMKTQHQYINDFKIDLKNLPQYAVIGDNPKTLKFIQSLTQDAFNFSQAEKLIGISRQTIKSHADKNLHGLKPIEIGNSKYITKENFIEYYRNYFDKHGHGFY